MLKTDKNQFFIDGKSKILLASEFHYFRSDPKNWPRILDQIKETGCNTVASYVPWLSHEEIENDYDFTGKYVASSNLNYFLELTKEKELYVVLRPGPYIMAEFKNEGLPYWLYKKYPNIRAVTWEKRETTGAIIDYLNPDFLRESKKWYRAVFDVSEKFLYQNNGHVIGFQLDNEIGMLNWVTNTADLSDSALNDFKTIFGKQYPKDFDYYAPSEELGLVYHRDLGNFFRQRFGKYVDILKSYLESFGLKDTFYFVNIHGTSAGRGKTFPIGISQLIESYQDASLIPGIDVYYKDIDLETFHDVYIVNALTESTIHHGQPLTALEFAVGSGNYGDNLGKRYLPSSVDFRIRMSIAQNHKLLNYYTMVGGFNQSLRQPVGDGNDRVAFTGERHGFAAPIQSDGSTNYTYPRLRQTTRMMHSLSEILGPMKEETDDLKIGFIADYFMTEYHYPKNDKEKEFIENLNFHRANTYWDQTIKQLLLLNYRFKAIWLEKNYLDPKETPLLVLGVAKYLDKDIQEKLVNYLNGGGKLLLVGELPTLDMLGNSCTVLIDYLEIKPKQMYYDWTTPYLTLSYDGFIKNETSFRTFYGQTLETTKETFLSHYPSKERLGYLNNHQVVFLTTNLPGHIRIMKQLMDYLYIKPKLKTVGNGDIHFLTKMSHKDQSFIHLLNLDHYDKKVKIEDNEKLLFDGLELDLFSQEGLMLPINISLTNNIKILWSTAEIYQFDDTTITFRLTQSQDKILIETDLKLQSHPDYTYKKTVNGYLVSSLRNAKIQKFVSLRFE